MILGHERSIRSPSDIFYSSIVIFFSNFFCSFPDFSSQKPIFRLFYFVMTTLLLLYSDKQKTREDAIEGLPVACFMPSSDKQYYEALEKVCQFPDDYILFETTNYKTTKSTVSSTKEFLKKHKEEKKPKKKKERWAWEFDDDREINLRNNKGHSAAVVYSNRLNATWHTWDQNGTGGENSVENDAFTAMIEAEKSARDQGFLD